MSKDKETVTEEALELYTVPKLSSNARALAYLAMRALGKPKGLDRMRHVAKIRKAVIGSSITDPDSGSTIWADNEVIVLASKKELETLRNAVLKHIGESKDDDAGEGVEFDQVEDGIDLADALDAAQNAMLMAERVAKELSDASEGDEEVVEKPEEGPDTE